ncbi:MAG: transposase [Saprospiraceae bacterium]
MIDTLVGKLKIAMDGVKDHRKAAGNLQHSLGDILMAAFAMFHLKDPSLLIFRQRLEERWANLRRVYGIKSVPGDTAMRQALDGVEPATVGKLFKSVLQVHEELGLWEGRKVLGNYLAISMDGTQHYCSSKKSCAHCLVKQKRNGETDYYHQLLAAVQVHPEQETVFPLQVEPIQQQDGNSKNDCEQNAAKRLIPRITESLPQGMQGLMLMDALYATGPCLKMLRANNLSYLATIKDGYVLVQASRMAEKGQLKQYVWTSKGRRHTAFYAHGLAHSGAHQEFEVNYLGYEERDARTGKELYKSSWVTDLAIEEANIPEMVSVARARWKVENETFNTLKNQGYQLEHNFGHGKQFLSSVLACLMMLAFLTDQLAQHADACFKKALAYCKTRKNLFEKVRQVFDLLPCMSMNVIYRFISKEVTLDFPMLE